MPAVDLIVRDAFLFGRDETVDIAVVDGRVSTVGPDLDTSAGVVIDADGRLTTPGVIDAHVHLDQAFAAEGNRTPRYHDEPFEKTRKIAEAAEYFETTSLETLTENAVRAARLAATNGVTRLRAHTYVDGAVGTKAIEAMVAARDRVSEFVDIEIVAFPQRGLLADPDAEAAAADALEGGADLLGGLDPASVNDDVDGTIEAWFDLATAHDVPLDVHIHDRGDPGLRSMKRLAAATTAHGYEGRVTVSHAFALADAADPAALADRFAEAGLGVVTCYLSTPPDMPIRSFRAAGVPVAMGTDQVRDMWSPHGNADPLQGALIESLRLAGPYTRNEGLATLWALITTGGASVLDTEYGIEPGGPADLVVFDADSAHWTIVTHPPVVEGIKDGVSVVEDGRLQPEQAECLGA